MNIYVKHYTFYGLQKYNHTFHVSQHLYHVAMCSKQMTRMCNVTTRM